MICETQLHLSHRRACNFFAFSEFESFIEYFESWAPSGGFYVSASQMGDEVLGSILLYGCLRSAILGSITSQEVFFSWRDLDAVIEMGMPERTTDVSTLHARVDSHLAEERREFVSLFTSDGENVTGSCCGDLAQHILSLSLYPSFHFQMDKIGRGLVYSIYNELSWKTTFQGMRR